MPNLLFVQFPHSGFEHQLTAHERSTIFNGFMLKEWNYGPHRRKFMLAEGQYLDHDNHIQEGNLYFWGEWEPMSLASDLDPKADGHKFPKYLQRPVLIKKANGKPAAARLKNSDICTNTDPFVFYENFLYSCCRQYVANRPSILQNLAPGSIILFGSSFDMNTPNPYFCIDTVFVVGDSRKYYPKSSSVDLAGFVPNDYFTIMGFGAWRNNNPFTCYHGVSYAENQEGPFSFVPCKTELTSVSGKEVGFERPIIRQEDLDLHGISLVDPKSNRNYKKTSCGTARETKAVWLKIKQLVESQGFSLGVKFSYRTYHI